MLTEFFFVRHSSDKPGLVWVFDNGVRITILKAVSLGLCGRGTAVAGFLSAVMLGEGRYLLPAPRLLLETRSSCCYMIPSGMAQDRLGGRGLFLGDGEAGLVCHRRGENGVFQRPPHCWTPCWTHLGAGVSGGQGLSAPRAGDGGAGGGFGTVCAGAGSTATHLPRGSPGGSVAAPGSQPCQ